MLFRSFILKKGHGSTTYTCFQGPGHRIHDIILLCSVQDLQARKREREEKKKMAAALYLSSIPKPTQTLSFSSSHSNFFNAKTLVVARSRTRIRTQKRLTCTCLFGLGVPELVVMAGVAALVFGPKKLPEVGRSIGKTAKSFQQAAKEFETELKKRTCFRHRGPSGDTCNIK